MNDFQAKFKTMNETDTFSGEMQDKDRRDTRESQILAIRHAPPMIFINTWRKERSSFVGSLNLGPNRVDSPQKT